MRVKKIIHKRGWMPSAFAIALGIAFHLLPMQAMAGEVRGCAKDNGKFRIVEDGEFCTGGEIELRFSTFQPYSETVTVDKPSGGIGTGFFNRDIAQGAIYPRGFCASDGTISLRLINFSPSTLKFVVSRGGNAPQFLSVDPGTFFPGSASAVVDQAKWSFVSDGKKFEVFGSAFYDSSTDKCTFTYQAIVGE